MRSSRPSATELAAPGASASDLGAASARSTISVSGTTRQLRIVHVCRAPVGGVLRHIRDLATAQGAAGHQVGLICDSLTGGDFETSEIAGFADRLTFGVTRLPMRRAVSLSDIGAARRVLAQVGALEPDVVHSHGAKGGVYGRLIATWLARHRPVARIYAPHGGSLHYDPTSLEGRLYFGVERLLERITDALIHVSAYEAETYRRKIGVPRCPAVVIPNGLREDEFVPVAPRPDARDLLFLGTFRELKGIDTLLEAIALLNRPGERPVTAHLVGQPDERPRFETLARALGIAPYVAFHDPLPAREAFALANIVVVPSRSESMPYVVLEAIAAGRPIVATAVGGIPEIFGPRAGELVPPDDAPALAAALARQLADPERAAGDAVERRGYLQGRFTVEAMRQRVDALYGDVLATLLAHRKLA